MYGSSGMNWSQVRYKLVRKYLKLKINDDNISFRNYPDERQHVYDLVKRTVINGESHSALLIGPRGSGKTTLINSVLNQLKEELESDAIIVKLNGYIHSDEKIALKSITAQMQLENAVGDRVFGTFAENLSFLLSCLQCGANGQCRSIIVILEECDLFCHSNRTQTLLYNLFDVTHNRTSPMCVIGTTNFMHIMESFEKRVRSRFSQRCIYLIDNDKSTDALTKVKNLFLQLLSLPELGQVKGASLKRRKKVKINTEDDTNKHTLSQEILMKSNMKNDDFEPAFVKDWNAHVASILADKKVLEALQKFTFFCVDEQVFRNIMFQLVSKISESKPYIDADEFVSIVENTVDCNDRVKVLHSLSTLEMCLVIAMKHGMDIFLDQPMNFEMVLYRFTKFANTTSSMRNIPRAVVLKAFEHLQALELIMPARITDSVMSGTDTTTARVQKEYKMYYLSVPVQDIELAVTTFKVLHTDVRQWYKNGGT